MATPAFKCREVHRWGRGPPHRRKDHCKRRRTFLRSGGRSTRLTWPPSAPMNRRTWPRKFDRASQHRGPKLFLALAACPTGWGFHPKLSDEISRLAIDTGVWPLKEAVNGEVRHTFVPNRFRPVEEYLAPQRRFEHLFQPERQEQTLRQIQDHVTEYWNRASIEVAPPWKP